MMAVEAGVQIAHHALAFFMVNPIVDPHHDAIRTHEVIDRRAFFQELWVRNHIKHIRWHATLRKLMRDGCTNTISRPHWHCRFIHDEFELFQMLTHRRGNRQHMR